MVVHQGSSIAQGHYIGYVRRSHNWYKTNDEDVRAVSWQTVKKKNAYILFYEEISIFEGN